MSEVKIMPCPFCGSDVNDDRDHAATCYFTVQDNFEKTCGGDVAVVLDAWNIRHGLDAQRLRADTAEADLLRTSDSLIAAEQRIAELKSVLERMLEDDDMPVHWFAQRIDAAINQKSEGESQ